MYQEARQQGKGHERETTELRCRSGGGPALRFALAAVFAGALAARPFEAAALFLTDPVFTRKPSLSFFAAACWAYAAAAAAVGCTFTERIPDAPIS